MINLMENCEIYFRYIKKNIYSYSALAPLFNNFKFTNYPKNGIMIYSFFTSQKDKIYDEIKKYKEKYYFNKTYFIAGGPHPSGNPIETLEYFDFVVLGEGEKTLKELVSYLIDKYNKKQDILYNDLKKINGIMFYDEHNNLVKTNKNNYIDLDKYPCFNLNGPYRPIEITRGCLYNCKYCQTPSLFGNKLRHRSIKEIIKYSKYFNDIRFISPNSFSYGSYNKNPNIQKINNLLETLKKTYNNKNIFFGTFPSEVRPEYINETLLDMIHKYCNNRSINIGVQSGSNRILKEISRAHTIEDVYNHIQICFDNDIIPIVDFIFGFPFETIEDLKESLLLIKWICKHNGKIRSHFFSPLPNTKYYNLIPKNIPREISYELGRMALNGNLSGRWET